MKVPCLLLLCTLALPALPAQIQGFRFEIESLGGRKLDQDDFKNNVLILDFWGTWCEKCREAVPGMVDLYRKYKHHGLEIVGLNYEKSTPEQAIATVRKFAREHGITYTLALGTPEIRKQVIGFSGYPTMLFFKKGMVFDHLEVGFAPDHLAGYEKWIRAELGLEGAAAPGEDTEKDPTAKAEPKARKITVPPGVIHEPGHHDKGFSFTVQGLDGKDRSFSDFAGKQVILVLTSTWDQEAADTARFLEALHGKYASKGVAVLAASLEMKKDRKSRVAAIEAFSAKHKPSYEILPVGLGFLKKIFEPSGVPMFLVFDKEGTLVLRRGNESKKEQILAAIAEVLE